MLPFALTIFTGAFLLFQVQPLIGKYILPWFGGTPAVWTTCMLFFQVVLLAGYAYAHATTRLFRPRQQAILHLVLLVVAVAVLPITPADSWKPKPGDEPTLRIMLLLLASIGIPYFVLSTTGPLMQAWFSRLHAQRSPYRLYALSNVGSLLALISYPFFFEINWTRRQQADYWSWGLIAFVLCCGWCAWLIWKQAGTAEEMATGATEPTEVVPDPTRWQRLMWLALPACASMLLLATTNKLCQDVAVIPFLWVLPLSIYLLTFILCFDSRWWYWRWVFIPLSVAGMCGLLYVLDNINDVSMPWQIVAFCGAMFACCMLCHGELYKLKPHPRHLTSFYLLISVGGALGGFLVAVVAPQLFASYAEFAWSLVLCAFLAWLVCLPNWRVPEFGWWKFHAWMGSSLVVLALGIAFYVVTHERENVVARSRNFYGALTILEYGKDTPGSRYLLLQHGRITHGFQLAEPEHRKRITSYYGESSGVALAIQHIPRTQGRRIGVVGLGTGTLAAFGKAADYVRIYEINSEVQRIATSTFTFVKDSEAKVEIVMGDARLSMENEPPQNLDVLALDAFSSDAIPVHLLTKEAVEIYLKHLAPDGVLAVHISNRYLDLEPVTVNVANHFKLERISVSDDNDADDWWIYTSTWVLLSKNKELLDLIAANSKSEREYTKKITVPLWTDDYASLFEILNK